MGRVESNQRVALGLHPKGIFETETPPRLSQKGVQACVWNYDDQYPTATEELA
jgi:hypothetical protein